MQHQKKIDRGDADPNSQAPMIVSNRMDWPGPIDRLLKNIDTVGPFGAYFFTLGPLLTYMILL
jgi:hypothetical protein